MNLIQVSSDIHFERGDLNIGDFINIIKKNAEILVLAGDIGDPFSNIYYKFIEYCSELFNHVLLITGNHEYYNYSIDEVDNKINKICDNFINVHYLNNKIFYYDGLFFIGSTLWSNIPENTKMSDLMTIKDYHKIKDFNPITSNNLFTKNLEFIENNLNNNINCIIISHHAPSYKCIPKEFHGDSVNCCFASHLDDLLSHPNLLGWIYGHTHNNYIEYTATKFLYSNCYRTTNYISNGTVL
jgi:predicted phosphodiesterase